MEVDLTVVNKKRRKNCKIESMDLKKTFQIIRRIGWEDPALCGYKENGCL